MSAEVAIQQLKGIRSALTAEGDSLDTWLESIGLQLDWSNTQHRLDWEDYCQVLRLVAGHRDLNWFSARGADSIDDDEAVLFRHGVIIGFDQPHDVLPWLVAPYGPLNAVSPYIDTQMETIVPGSRYRLWTTMLDRLSNSVEHNYFSRGVFSAFPRILYEADAKVSVAPRNDGADFFIEFAPPNPEAYTLRTRDRARPRPDYLVGVGETYLALVESQRKLQAQQRRVHALEVQAKQLEKQESLGAVASGVAHDFNNILQALVGQLDLIRTHDDVPDSVIQDIDSSIATCERGMELTERLRSYAVNSPSGEDVINIADLFTRSRPMLQSVMNREQQLDIKLAPTDLNVRAERSGLENAILNLVINARDAMGERGKLEISSDLSFVGDTSKWPVDAPSGHYVRLRFKDSGSGITDEVRSRLFDPYFTTKGEAGTGLGLSMVWGFAKRSRGHIEVTSAPGDGATFELLLPTESVSAVA